MADTHDTDDWQRWQLNRKKRSGEPDEETVRAAMEAWRKALTEGSLTEEDLDQELVRLLESIHKVP